MADFSQYEPLPIHGEPGVGVVGTNRYKVGVQSEAPDIAAWSARQPNLDRAKATEEANRIAKEGLYLDHLMLNQRTTTSARAVEAAMTFQAMRNYERDYSTAISAGLSPSQAGVQAMARNPGILKGTGGAAIVRALTPPPTPTVHNLPGVDTPFVQLGNSGRFAPADNSTPLGPASVVTDPDSGNRIGLRIPGGPRTATFRLDTQPPKPGSLSAVDKERIKDFNRQEIELRKQLPTTPPKANYFGGQAKVDAYSALTNSIGGVRAKRDRILDGTNSPAAKPIRVRKKSDGPKGAVFLYPGNASDVNLEKYDILPPLP